MEKTERDLEQDNRKRIADNIKYLLAKQRKTQDDFRKYCKEKYNYDINQGNLRKRISGTVTFGPMLLAYLCEYLGVSMEQVCYENMDPMINVIKRSVIHEDLLESFSVNKENLKKYYGTYHCYFYPTIKDENQVIKGRVSIREIQDETYAHVEIVLKVPKKNKKGFYSKKYHGIMLLSSKLGVCFCIVTNPKLGECNFLTFRYNRTLNTVKNQGGLVAVCTVSAGFSKVPVVHRMLICRNQPNESTLRKLLPSLYLNRSNIIIEKNKLQKIIKECQADEIAERCILDNIKIENLCEVPEAVLHLAKEQGNISCSEWEFVSKVREKAYNAKYNKIGSKADEQVIELMTGEGTLDN